MLKRTLPGLMALSLLTGCATHVGSSYVPLVDRPGPNFYQDLEDCQAYARNEATAAQQAAAGAVAGALIGAVLSAVILDRSADRATLAAGALGGALGGAGRATENQESIIKNCMIGRGYSVLR